MNLHCVLTSLLALVPIAAGAVNSPKLPYKEPMSEGVRSKQPIVYARVTDHGFGVQYRRASPVGAGTAGFLGSLAGGFPGMVVGTAVDRIANMGPTDLSQDDAEKLAPLFDRATAQQDLETALGETLRGLTLFASAPVVQSLAPGAPTDAAAFSEDPVLVVELYASLITNYRGMQVTAIAYELSPTQSGESSGTTHSRVYRNRFDYVSSLLPEPPAKTVAEIRANIKANVKEINARYRGRKLTQQEQEQRKREIEEAEREGTFEGWREPLIEQWLADNGVHLRETLKVGTTSVIQLLGRDLLDPKPGDVSKPGRIAVESLPEPGSRRYINIFSGEPFAGALISEPHGLTAAMCEGIAFSKTLSQNPQPKLCVGEGEFR